VFNNKLTINDYRKGKMWLILVLEALEIHLEDEFQQKSLFD